MGRGLKVYFDTEFVSLWTPEIMSVGFAAEDGQTLYIELDYDSRFLSRFSRKVVVPLMDDEPTSVQNARRKIRGFLNQWDAPELVCDFIGDWWLLLGLFPSLPDYAVPRCAMQGAPDLCYADPSKRHNALADAIALRTFKPAIQQDTD